MASISCLLLSNHSHALSPTPDAFKPHPHKTLHSLLQISWGRAKHSPANASLSSANVISFSSATESKNPHCPRCHVLHSQLFKVQSPHRTDTTFFLLLLAWDASTAKHSSSITSSVGSMEEEAEEARQKRHGFIKEEKKANHNHSHNNNPSELAVMRLAALAISFNVRLRSSDMPVQMQEHALRYTRSLISMGDPSPNPTHTHLARALKKEFDSAYGRVWHCVIGTSFGSFVTHTGGGFIYFSIDSLSVLLFKTEVHLITQPPPPPP